MALYHADRRREAIGVLEKVRERLAAGSVERREAEQVLGLSLYLEGRFADAIPWLERTRDAIPDNLELNFTLGQAYIQVRDAAHARAGARQDFGVAADSTAAHVVTAQLMIRLQMEALAEAELTQALARDPRTLRANFLLGQLALFRGQLDEAVDRSTRELAINPSDAMASYQLGDALLRQNKGDEAITALQRSLWLNPFYSGPYILLGRAYMQEGSAGDRRGHAAARHRVRPEQPRRALPARPAAAAAGTRRRSEAGVRHRRAARHAGRRVTASAPVVAACVGAVMLALAGTDVGSGSQARRTAASTPRVRGRCASSTSRARPA